MRWTRREQRQQRWAPRLLGFAALQLAYTASLVAQNPAPIATEVPAEYRGAAAALEASETATELRRAEEHFTAGAWEPGLGVLQELLARVTAAAPRRRAPPAHKPEEPKPDAAPQPGGRRLVIFNRGGEALDDAEAEQEPELAPAEEVASRDGIRLEPVATTVRRRLLDLPPEARDFYLRAYEPAARAALDKARVLPVVAAARELRLVADRYPITDAGREARELAADLHLDAGRFLEASRAYAECLELAGASAPGRPALLARCAAALALAGLPALAAERLGEIERSHSEALIPVGGEATPGHALRAHPLFERLLAASRASPASVAHGGAALPAVPDVHRGLGSRARWVLPLVDGKLEDESAAARHQPPPQPCPVAVSEGLAYVRVGDDVVALDVTSAKRRWSSSLEELRGGAPQRQSGYFAFDDQDVARLAQGLALVPAEAHRAPFIVACEGRIEAGQTQSGKVVYRPNRLVALNARNGKLAWLVGGVDETGASSSAGAARRSFAFAGPPVWTGGRLVAPALRGEGFYAVGLSREGKTRWTRRLYTLGASQVERYGRYFSPAAQLAGRDGIVAVAAGHGFVVALDAASGDVLWSSRYRSGLRSGYSGRVWSAGGPILTARYLIAAPLDSDHLAVFDRDSGSLAWDKPLGTEVGSTLLGATDQLVLVGGRTVRALRLADGSEAWKVDDISGSTAQVEVWSPYQGYQRVRGAPVDSAVCLENALVALTRDGHLAALETASGKLLQRVRLFDPRLSPREPVELCLAGDALLGVTGTRAFRLEPQSASWQDVGTAGDARLYERSRLLRAEGRHEEALATLDQLLLRLRSSTLREQVTDEIIQTARAAAEGSGDPRFLTSLLGRQPAFIRERDRAVTLRLLEANLHERGGPGASLAAAVERYLELARLDGVMATSPEGFEVDAGAYASDALRRLRARAQRVDDPAGEERTLAQLAVNGSARARARAFVLLRRPHLAGTDGKLLEELIEEAQADADGPRALEALTWLEQDGPTPVAASLAEKLAAHRASAVKEPSQPGLAELLDASGDKRWTRLSWHGVDDGFLAAIFPGSAPLPALVAIAGSSLRLYDRQGKVAFQRELPEYPDVSDTKLMLQAHVEEPASVHAGDGDLLLLSAAGLYVFRGAGSGATLQPRSLKLAWARPWPHPLAELANQRSGRWWGGMPVPEGQNFFAEGLILDGGDPLVLEPTGALRVLHRRSGKLRLDASSPSGRPASPPQLLGPWIATQLSPSTGGGLWLERLPGTGAPRSGRTRVFERTAGAQPQGSTALAGAHLAVVFSGASLEVVDSASRRLLWRTPAGFARLAFVAGARVWLSEEGRLVARSLQSGRELSSLPLPEGTSVVAAFSEPDGGRTLVLSRASLAGPRYYWGEDRASTGTDLHLLRLGPGGDERWRRQLHTGPVTYRAGRLRAVDGRCLYAFNGEGKEEKWYTHVVRVRPEDGAASELCAAEVHGKGTGQPPRLLLLDGGIGVGNADGFGWFSPAAPEAPGEAGGLGPAPASETEKGN